MKLIPVISYKVVLFISVILVSVVFYAPSLYLLEQNQLDKVSAENKAYELSVERNLESMIGYAVNTGDKELLNTILSNVSNYEFIHSVTVVDTKGAVLGYINNKDQNSKSDEYLTKNISVEGISAERSIPKIINVHDTEIYQYDSTNSDELSTSEGNQKLGQLTISFVEPVIDRESIDKSFSNILTISGIFSLIPILIVFVVFREQNNQLRIILESAKRLAKGEREVKLSDKTGIKEIREFSNAFNEISDELERGRDNLSEKSKIYDMKSNVLQLAAHELRTPMGRVRTYLDIAIERTRKKRPAEAMDTLKLAYGDVDSLTRRISYILNLSALENGSLKIKNECFDVRDMFEEIDHQFGVLCENSSNKSPITWSCKTNDVDPMWVVNDFQLISVIVSNAIDNAIKYTDMGFVDVKYEIVDDSLQVIVKDTGVGLSEKEIKGLQDTVSTLENTISRTKDGWGIGFKTMRRFAEFMNGSVEIQSKKGFGTEVQIRIPITRATDELIELSKGRLAVDETDSSVGEVHETIDEFDTGKFNVIVIDNDAGNIEVMRHLFSGDLINREDISVTYVDDPVEAIVKLESTKFDLILLDYHMPEMDGMDLLRFLRDQPSKNKNTKKIVITADTAIPEDVFGEMNLLADEIASKGFGLKEIMRWINPNRREPRLVAVSATN